MMTRLPKVKNKHVRRQPLTIKDIFPPQLAGGGKHAQALIAAAESVATGESRHITELEQRQAKLQEEAEVDLFREESRALRSRRSQVSQVKYQASLQAATSCRKQTTSRPVVKAILRPRKGCNWQRRRLLHLALRKESIKTCPMAKLRFGFGAAFVASVFAYL
mmetsp:Transcript_20317/g.45554  ORF Transcript_20317/g.45554 Transcript_20317/m.45554 type:complete len:163 (-) Transcript_20317:234-722(-)